jgi:hypothetical protein
MTNEMGRLVWAGLLLSSSMRAQSRRALASLPAAEVNRAMRRAMRRVPLYSREGQSGGTTNVRVGFHEADEVGAGDGLDGHPGV